MKKALLLFASLIFVVSISACSGGSGTTSAEPSPGESTSTPAPVTIESIITSFQNAGLTVSDITKYDENTDPNQLLGRPNQYIAKTGFTVGTDTNGNKIEGSIEQFSNATDLGSRKSYIESVASAAPIFAQYMYDGDLFLLRIDKGLAPTDAEKYEATFNDCVK